MRGDFKLAGFVIISALVLFSCKDEVVHKFNPKENSANSVVLLGNTFVEQMQNYNYFETLLYKSFPDRTLKVRNLGWSADEVNLKPRPLNFGSIDKYLEQEKADYIITSYGLNEAFKGKDSVEAFSLNLSKFLKHVQQQKYNGHSNPEIILISPIAHENMGGLLPDPEQHNKNLELYTDRMRSVANELDIPFINLYHSSKNLMEGSSDKLTYNGIHLNDYGYRKVSEIMARSLGFPVSSFSTAPPMDDLRKIIKSKNQHYFYKYRAVNGEYIYGRRNKPYGIESFPPEQEKLEKMVGALDSLIWEYSSGNSTIDMSEVDKIVNHTFQYKYEPVRRTDDLLQADDLLSEPSLESFTMKEGYKIELYASEQDFPIGNATSFTFDPKGRLWISTLESFPQALPGSLPNDKLVILEDNNKDGKADNHIIYADGLYEPLGFELGDGGVYVSQPPDLVFLKDTNNDMRADVRVPLLHGFGTEDIHHAISAFTWGPDGALYMQDGTFLHDQVETPYGPVRGAYATTWRYEPYTKKLTPYISYPYSNPWGNVFMRNGMHLIGDASPGKNFYATPLTVAIDYPHKHMEMDDFPTTRLRPTCGIEVISSSHFPESVQGHMLQPNIVGFQGIKQYRISKSGSGVIAHEVEPLLQSSDINFRPVDLQFGPDGALYILDFYNPIVGHMTYSFRDPNRDHVHGRIWRVTYEEKNTLNAHDLTQLSISELLDQLKEYEDRIRYRTRTQLREFPKEEVIKEIGGWVKNLDPNSKGYDQNRLEALWLYQQFHEVNELLLGELFQSSDGDVRASATRVLFYWKELIPNAQERLIAMSEDPYPRVRLEAIASLSHFKTEAAVNALLNTIDLPMDYYIYYSLNESFKYLRPVWMNMFKNNKNFLKNEPKKAFYMLNSVTSKNSLAIPHFIQQDPENSKYSLKAFDQKDYQALSDAPAIVKFWIGKKDVPDSIKLNGLKFLSEIEGKKPGQIFHDQIEFMNGLDNEFKYFLNWKSSNQFDQTESLDNQKVNQELKEDIIEFSTLLDRHEDLIKKTKEDDSESEDNTNKKIIRISAIPGQMAYDKTTFTVVAGQTVEIVFSNPDHMQHNLLILKPGKLEEVGEMADKMSGEPDGFKKEFIPETDNVLFATPLLDQDETYSLIFTAPETLGDFPFACTFPGHWRIMNGIMKVISKEEIL